MKILGTHSKTYRSDAQYPPADVAWSESLGLSLRDDVASLRRARAKNGVDVFRIFDAMNYVRNLKTAIKAAKDVDGHAQGTMSYTVSPVHTLEKWVRWHRNSKTLAVIRYVSKIWQVYCVPMMHSNWCWAKKDQFTNRNAVSATTGLSVATYQKSIDAGIDMLDTAISPMSMTYGHSPTETLVAMTEGSDRDTGLSLTELEDIASYFRDAGKYAQFEGSQKESTRVSYWRKYLAVSHEYGKPT